MSHPDESQLKEKPFAFSREKEESALLYFIPKDYFLNFPDYLMQGIKAIEAEELRLPVSSSNPFSVPEGYFEGFPQKILLYAKSEERAFINLLNSLPKDMPFVVEEGYFESVTQGIFKKLNLSNEDVESAEIEILSPLLTSLRDKTAFEIPEGYFEQPRQKTIAFKQMTAQKSIKWMRWAAAAMVVCIFSLGGWQFLNVKTAPANNYASVNQRINNIPDAEIQEYLNASLNDYEVAMLAQSMDAPTDIFEGIPMNDLKSYLEQGAY